MDLLKPFSARFVLVLGAERACWLEEAASAASARAVHYRPATGTAGHGRRCPLRPRASGNEAYTNCLGRSGGSAARVSPILDATSSGHTAQPAAVCPTSLAGASVYHPLRARRIRARFARAAGSRRRLDAWSAAKAIPAFFYFAPEALRRHLPLLFDSAECIGKRTGEFDPFYRYFRSLDGLITAPIMTETESVGVNSPADAAYLEKHCWLGGLWHESHHAGTVHPPPRTRPRLSKLSVVLSLRRQCGTCKASPRHS